MGKFKRLFLEQTLSAIVALAMVVTGIPVGALAQQETAVAAASTSSNQNAGLADNVQDGAILHCWCWSFNTIRENMADIAAAGFTTVQTSPANACKDTYPTMKLMGNDTEKGTDGCWWWQYQPTDWTIGNYQLGTEADFKAMCAEADKYGIKVIVDVIPNHTTPDMSAVSQNLINAAGGINRLYHSNGFNEIEGNEWSDRYECTTGQMGGLPDVDTENPDFQVYFLNYLNSLIACGADGFRYDTAKHIGVPSDPLDEKSKQYTSYPNFWPVVTGKESVKGVSLSNADQMFIYGEVLQGDNVPEAEYAQYMRETASSFGGSLRDAVKKKDFNVSTMSNLQHASPTRVVTWVESHDTYCNAGESVELSDTQIRLAWAVIAARKDGTPLFFSRPDGSNGWSNRWGNNVLGAKGNDQFKSDEVAAVNFFRNAMAGKSETLRNPNGNTQILQIDRGTEGTCIINLGNATTLNSVPTSMADGTYTDQVSGRTFTVSGGKLSGQLDGSKVAVIYNPTNEKLNAATSGGNTTFSSDTVEIVLTAKNITNTTYSTSEGASGSFANGDVITVGASLSEGQKVTVTLKGQGASGQIVKEFTFEKVGKSIAYLKLPSGWSAPYCYVYNTAGANNGAWPGVKMESAGSGIYKYEVPDTIESPLVIFYGGDNSHRYPADMEDGLSLSGSMIYEDGSWKEYSTGGGGTGGGGGGTQESWKDKVDGSYDVYLLKPSGWGDTVYCYAYISKSVNNASWPGAKMDSLGEGVYGYNLPDGWTSAKILFTDGSNQIPGASQPGMDWADGTSKLYANGQWSDVEVAEQKPTVKSSLAEGSTFDTESTTITLTLEHATKGTYCVDDGPVKEFTNSATVVIGKGKIADAKVVVKATATDGTQTTETTFTYTKKFNASKNGGSVVYASGSSSNAAASTTSSTSGALGGKYATNPNGYGANKTITSAADFDESMIIAQGVANDDPAAFRGTHEAPKFDLYSLYGAWDNTNLYIGIQYTNVIDVVDPAQSSPQTGRGKPNGADADIPQMLVFDTRSGDYTDGTTNNTAQKTAWNTNVKFAGEANVDKIFLYSPKEGINNFALFSSVNGIVDYETAIAPGYQKPLAGASVVFEDGFFGSSMIGIKANGYEGYVPSDLTSAASNWVDFLTTSHSTAQDTFSVVTIPLEYLGVTASDIASNGIGVMAVATYGASGIGSLPMDMTMLDCATEAFSQDDSTSAEKEDADLVTVPLAQLGAAGSGGGTTTKGTMTVNFGADRSSPQADTTDLTLKAVATGGQGSYTYQFLIDGKKVQSSSSNTYAWNTTGGTHKISAVVTDGSGHEVTVVKEYDIEGEVVSNPLEITSFKASPASTQKSGSKVQLTASAAGGVGNYKYKFLVRDEQGNWYKLRDFADSSTYTWITGSAGKKTLYVDVQDEAGTVVRSQLNYTVTKQEELKITSFEIVGGGTQVTANTRPTLKAEATGGSGSYTYKFLVYNPAKKEWYKLRDFGTDNTQGWNATGEGDRILYVDVQDSEGTTVRGKLEVTITNPQLQIDSFESSEGTNIAKGTAVKLSVTASGGSGSYTYKFLVYNPAKKEWYKLRDFGTGNTQGWNATGEGDRILYVDVQDSAGTTVRGKLEVTITNPQLQIDSFESSEGTNIAKGTAVKLSVTASGGSGSYTYKFLVYNPAKKEWYKLRDFGTGNTQGWNATGEGDRILYVDVQDSAGTTVRGQLEITVTGSQLQIDSFKSSEGTTVAKGTTIKLSVAASGGSGSYTYKFLIYNPSTKEWYKLRDFGTGNTQEWKATAEGSKILYVDVQDSTGATVRGQLEVTVTGSQLQIDSFKSSEGTTVAKGTTIKLSVAASGGSGSYTYKFLIYNPSTKEWYKLRDFGTSNTQEWKATAEGNRILYVDVQDSEGTTVRELLNVTVK